MKITVLCVGKLKERYFIDAAAEYVKRLKAYANIEIIEVADENALDAETAKDKESVRLEKYIDPSAYNIALAIDGERLSSEELERHISGLAVNGRSHFAFIIGGSCGLSPKITDRCDFRLSFSAMTFPHRLMRIILLEQIYRSFKIKNNEPYHR